MTVRAQRSFAGGAKELQNSLHLSFLHRWGLSGCRSFRLCGKEKNAQTKVGQKLHKRGKVCTDCTEMKVGNVVKNGILLFWHIICLNIMANEQGKKELNCGKTEKTTWGGT